MKDTVDTNGGYWLPSIDDVIVRYNSSVDENERERMYRDHLEIPMRKLVECVVAKNLGQYIDIEAIEEDTLHHIVLQLRHYNKDSGRSFSYFTTIATRYIWNHNTRNLTDRKLHVSIQGVEFIRAMQVEDYYLEYGDETPRTHHRVPWPETLKVFTPTPDETEVSRNPLLDYLNRNDTCGGKKERDKNIVNSLRFIFRDAEEHPKINKKAILEKIRQQTGCTTQQIKNTVRRIKQNYEQAGA